MLIQRICLYNIHFVLSNFTKETLTKTLMSKPKVMLYSK